MRWPVITALLLPLPFAALPLLSIFFSPGGAPGAEPPIGGHSDVVLNTDAIPVNELPVLTSAPVAANGCDFDAGRSET